MKRIIVILLTFLLYHTSLAQNFEPGYIVRNDGSQLDCKIDNLAWNYNPTGSITVLFNDEQNPRKIALNELNLFGIYGKERYAKYTVQLDRSSDNLSNLSEDRRPEFSEETLFLKVILEGEKSLLSYQDGSIKRFYHASGDGNPEPLIYKRYRVTGSSYQMNEGYKQVLLNNLRCDCLSSGNFESVRYYQKEILNLYIKYHECDGKQFKNYSRYEKKDLLNLSIRPGLNLSHLSLSYDPVDGKDADYGNKLSFRLGVEFEFLIKENMKNFTILLEPNFQSYKSAMEVGLYNTEVNYKSIEIPFGLRYYIAGDNIRPFINIGLVADFAFGSSIVPINAGEINIRNRFAGYAGLGIHAGKFGTELRYGFPANILSQYQSWNSKYSTLSIVLAYRLK